ncbi:MAG TPA: hypothetical protein VGB30_01265 [bacterium]|jgi:hypothetical protein
MDERLENLGGISLLRINLTNPDGWVVLLLIFNVLWIAVFAAWKYLPEIVRRLFIIVPIFLAIHFLAGKTVEGRLYLPILPLFVMAGLFWLGSQKSEILKKSDNLLKTD